ncbi:hypothetical protein Pres01_43710 [Metapseudomonas resinovorans]|nr:hypothetical protein Pres01_43710 [Pseudomonas resinovorans]
MGVSEYVRVVVLDHLAFVLAAAGILAWPEKSPEDVVMRHWLLRVGSPEEVNKEAEQE